MSFGIVESGRRVSGNPRIAERPERPAVADVIREHELAAGGSESAGDRIGCEALPNDGATGFAWPAKTFIPAGLSTVVEAA